LRMLPVEIDYTELVPLLNKAAFSLGTLAGLFRIIPNPCLLISPLANREAALSSKIEGTMSTLTDMYKYEAGEEADHKDVAEVVNYRKSLDYAVQALKEGDFDLELLKKMHEILLTDVRGGEKDRGKFREIQNWIGKVGSSIGKARYVPPPSERLDTFLENLRQYMVHDEKDPLVQAGLIHSQFEAIHPFIDGNGRIGRLLIPLFLYKKKLLPYPILYISEYLEENRDEYYECLWRVTRDNDYLSWLKFFLTAVEAQCKRTQKTIYEMMALYEETKSKAATIKSPYSLMFVDLIFKRPIFSRKVVETALETNRTTVMRLLQSFTEMGIVNELPNRKRNRLYRFDKLFDTLDERYVEEPD